MTVSRESGIEAELQLPELQLRRHIPQLDGLRGLAILMVTIYRFGRETSVLPASPLTAQLIKFGAHGVELFFVLSGFLITGILLDTRGHRHQLRNFFARRSLRILPLYFLAIILCAWIIPALAAVTGVTSIERVFEPAREQQFYLWFYLTNVQMALVDAWCFGPLDHFWSLAVEEHFYLAWPLIILWCRSRILIWGTVSLIVACVASRTAWLAQGGSATAAEVLTVWRCDGLLMGALAAMLLRSPCLTWHNLARAAAWIWLPLLALAMTIDAADRRMWLVNYTLWNLVWFCLLLMTVNGIDNNAKKDNAKKDSGSASIAARKLHGRWPSAALSWMLERPWLRGLGKLSYGMYVFQAPLIPLVAAAGWTAGVSLPIDLLYVVLMFTLTVGVAWCSWHGFEKHWLRLKDYFPQSDTGRAERVEMGEPQSTWKQGLIGSGQATLG